MEAVNAGIEALATTKVVMKPVQGGAVSGTTLHAQGGEMERQFSGSGSDTDIVVSSARAYLAAVNKLIRWNMRREASEQVAEVEGAAN